MVIYLFLRNIPATIIPSLSVPLSLIGALAIMYQAGFSLDNLSLMALTVATGFVVDDAIVVIENIARFLEQGDSPYDAAMKGSAQIGFTIISLTVSLLAVLIPLLFMGDVVGRLFHEFAITLAAAIILSAIVSLTLVPMLCAKLLRAQGHGGGEASGGRFFQALTRFYGATLRVALNHQGFMLLVALGTFLLTGYLYMTIPKGFFPDSGHGRHPGRDPGGGGDFIRPDGRPSTGLGESDPDRSGRPKPVLVHRRRRLECHAQLRPLAHQPQAACEAHSDGKPNHSADPTGNGECAWHSLVHAARAGLVDRHSCQRHAISVHPREPGSGDAADMDAEGVAAPEPDSLDRRCGERFAAGRALGDRRPRPRQRGAIRHHARHHRQCALRRLRPAHHLDHLHPEQPISRDSRRRSVHGALGEIARFDLSAVRGLDHRTDAARIGRQFHGQDLAFADLAFETVSGDHDLVQPCAGRVARRGVDAIGQALRRSTCRRASP